MSLKKIVLFISIVIVLVVGLKLTTGFKEDPSGLSYKSSSDKTTHYFIGSSRVRRGINPEIIKDCYSQHEVFNMGIYWSTFLSNVILADFLIKQEGKKVLYIELSPLINSFSKDFIEFSKMAGFNPFLKANQLVDFSLNLQQLRFRTDIFNQYLFSLSSIKEDVKHLLSNHETNKSVAFGYEPSEGNEFSSVTPFITYAEIQEKKKVNVNISQYKSLISHLISLGEKHNTKIVFFLPVTYNKQEEKNIIIPIYHWLSEDNKLVFTEQFLSKIRDSKYMKDKSHFNKQGSDVYSTLLCPLLATHFE